MNLRQVRPDGHCFSPPPVELVWHVFSASGGLEQTLSDVVLPLGHPNLLPPKTHLGKRLLMPLASPA